MPWMTDKQLAEFNERRKELWIQNGNDPEEFPELIRMHLDVPATSNMERAIEEAFRVEKLIQAGGEIVTDLDFGDLAWNG